EQVEATLPHMPRAVAAMVRLQLLTGCRTGEILIARGCDFTIGEPTWTYRPSSHKNSWRNQARVIPIGPRGQAIIKEFLRTDLDAFLFDPRQTLAESRQRRREGRKSRPTPSELAKRRPVESSRAGVGDRYSRRSYAVAIMRACKRANVPVWS